MREAYYRCPTCGATKEIRDQHGRQAFPAEVICGWRGCPDRAVRVPGAPEITHRCPLKGSGTMPCCGRTPFEVPRHHRMTLDPKLVTCG